MQMVTLPAGARVVAVGQGSGELEKTPRAGAAKALQAGLDLGMTLSVTAEVYGVGKAEEFVGEAVRGEVGDAALVRRQRTEPTQHGRPGPGAGRVDLGAGPTDERRGPTDLGELERLAVRLSSFGRPARMAQRGAERGERLRALEPRRGVLEQRARLLEMLDAGIPVDRTEHAQRAPDRAR